MEHPSLTLKHYYAKVGNIKLFSKAYFCCGPVPMPWMLETLKSCTGKKEVTSSSYASGLYIYVIKSLKGRSIISMKVYYLNNMQGSLDRGSIPEVGIGTLGCAFEYRQGTQPDCGTQRLASWLFFRELHDMLVNLINFGLLALSSSDCK